MESNRVYPSEIEAERSLIGSIFVDPQVMNEISDFLSPDDFYDIKNRLIYSALLQLFRDGSQIDLPTLVSKLKQNNTYTNAGETQYLMTIIDSSYTAANVETYLNLVKDASVRRKAIETLDKLTQKGFDLSVSADEYIDDVEKQVFELSRNKNVSEFNKISAVTKKVIDQIDDRAKLNSEVTGLNTGFDHLNKLTLGFQEGSIVILAARPAVGKSAMALNLALNVATHNKNGNASVAVFSLEMPQEQLVERMLASDASINLSAIKKGNISPQDQARFNTSCAKLSKLNIFFDDSSGINVSTIRAKCRKLKQSPEGLDFVVIDYLQLITGESRSKANRVEEVGQISRSLKLMALELKVPVLVLSQLSRNVEQRIDKTPILADLRESGSIEQDADIVMFLSKPETPERKGEEDLIIAKNRSGSTSEGLPFTFRGEHQRFIEKKEGTYNA